MEIHIWDLLKMSNAKIVVDIEDFLKERIKYKIKNKLYVLSKELKINPTRLYEYFIWKGSLIPLEKQIILYKQIHVPGKNSVKNPKFPIKITPYFTSIIANLFFDGSVPKDGKGTYYNQKNKDIMMDFIKKINYVFGDVFYSLKLDHRGVLKCRIPRLIGEICRYIYNINSFGTFDAKIPQLIFNLGKNHEIAFVLTGIIDEGSISFDGSIIFGVCNEELAGGVLKLCMMTGIETTKLKQKKNSNYYYFYIKSPKIFISKYKKLKKEFPLINLRHKENRLVKSLEIKNQKFLYTKDFADKRRSLILNELLKNRCSVNYLSSKYLIPPKTVRRYMYQFMEEGKVNRRRIGINYFYHLG